MTNKLYLIQKAGRLTCHWVLTGDPKLPLACVWTESASPRASSTASSTNEPPSHLAMDNGKRRQYPPAVSSVAGVSIRPRAGEASCPRMIGKK
jgi:hypothetical protein